MLSILHFLPSGIEFYESSKSHERTPRRSYYCLKYFYGSVYFHGLLKGSIDIHVDKLALS